MNRSPVMPMLPGTVPIAVPIALLAAALAGCAQNAVRLGAAGEASASGRAAVAAAAGYFDAIEQRRRDAAAALVASDPSCLPVTPLRIQVPAAAGADAGADTGEGAGAPLCPQGAPAPGHVTYANDIGTSPRAVLAPRLALLAAIADYADALAAILEAPQADVSAQVTAFAEQVDRVARFTDFVAGTDLPDVNAALASEQGRSLGALIAFAHDLAAEAQRTQAVRALVTARGAAVDEALASLGRQVADGGGAGGGGGGAARNADDLYGNALLRTYLRRRAALPPEQREVLAARILAAREAAAQAPARTAAVIDAIDLAARAQAGLRAALGGRLTPAQRQAAARLNVDRITRALGLVAALADPL